jgi:nicotinamidase/pyrazinamidase
LAIVDGDQILEPLNRALREFQTRGLPIFATRNWHPPDHCSFEDRGGPWPPHCIAESEGAELAEALEITPAVRIISKGSSPDRDAYSGFEGTDLNQRLRELDVSRLYVGGLATDYCILNTVRDAVGLGYQVFLLMDAMRAVNLRPGDEQKAFAEMEELGAVPITTGVLGSGSGTRAA